jgi:predicted permease
MSWFRRDPDGLDDEIRDYLERETALNIEKGMPPDAARHAARRKFGNPAYVKEEVWYQSPVAAFHAFWQDVRYGLRNLRRNPQFTLIAVLSLALGIAANSAVFSVICSFWYPVYPYKDYRNIVHFQTVQPKISAHGELAVVDFGALRGHARSVSAMAAGVFGSFHGETPSGDAASLLGLHVTPNFFSFLGVAPQLGRDFRREEDGGSQPPVAILGYGYWQQRFGGRTDAIGQTLRLDGVSHTVIGVLPAWFHWRTWRNTGCDVSPGTQRTCLDVYVPLKLDELRMPRRDRSIYTMARLAPGVTPGQAEAEARGIYASADPGDDEVRGNWQLRLTPMNRPLGPLPPGFVMMQAVVVFVLLIACANVANLLLARGAARGREMAVRAALGAGRFRICRQLLTESLILAGISAVFAMVLTAVAARLMGMSYEYDRLDGALDERVLLFTGIVSLVTVLLFGLAPGLQSARAHPSEALKEAGRPHHAGRGFARLRTSMVAGAIALATVLLIGALLVTQSLTAQLALSPGFDPRHLLVALVSTKTKKFADDGLRERTLRQLLTRISEAPGVDAAAMMTGPPLISGETVWVQKPEDARSEGERFKVRYRAVTADYFRMLGVPVLEGRDFRASDEGRPEVIINRTMAAQYWPGEDPIGKRLRVGALPAKQAWREVIGVFAGIKDRNLMDAPHAEVVELTAAPSESWVTVRVKSNPGAFAQTLRTVVAAVDADLSISYLETMPDAIANQLGDAWRAMHWLSCCAIIALTMASLGIYGVVSYLVVQRRHEIGVRIALGATRRDIGRLVAGQTLRIALAGVALGLALAFLMTGALGPALYGVGPRDPATLAGAAAVLVVVALAASLAPLRRSIAVDPVQVLKYE